MGFQGHLLFSVLLVASPARGLVSPLDSPRRSAHQRWRTVPGRRSLVVVKGSVDPEELDKRLEEAGASWRPVLEEVGASSSALLTYVEWLRADRKKLQGALESAGKAAAEAQRQAAQKPLTGGSTGGGGVRFDFGLAAELAGFAFETYNAPEGARWETAADGTRVAFKSEDFCRSCYAGVLTVTLTEADQLPKEDLMESLASGLQSGFRPQVWLAVVEGDEAKDPSKLPPEGVRKLRRAFDVGKSSTAKAKDYKEKKEGLLGGEETYSRATWQDEQFFLYVRDPAAARLVVSVEETSNLMGGQSKRVVGATSTSLAELLPVLGTPTAVKDGSKASAAKERDAKASNWPGWPLKRWPAEWGPNWLALTVAPEEGKGGRVAGAAAAGAMVAGPVGAMAGAAAASLWKDRVQGRVKLGLSYSPVQEAFQEAAGGQGGDGATKGQAPKGGSPGVVDWTDLSGAVGVEDRASQLEFCAFVDGPSTDTQAALWRDKRAKRVVVAFRGTSDPGDLVTDVQIQQTPWVAKTDQGQYKNSDEGKAMVHAGFRGALESISQRLKELVVAAVDGDASEWEVLITGHSLGGALATLFAQDLARHGLDAGRSLPSTRASVPWWGRLARGTEAFERGPPPRPKRLVCYTFGCPRVGNQAFAKLFENLPGPPLEIYRVVNGADIVARLPRHGNTVGQLLDYEHCGKTVLVSDGDSDSDGVEDGASSAEGAGAGAAWVEGETDGGACPLRDQSPLVDPMADGALLFEALREGVKQKSALATLDKLRSRPLSDLTQLVGLDSRFVEAELTLVNALASGDAIVHHLEPSYFTAMKRAARAQGFQVPHRDQEKA